MRWYLLVVVAAVGLFTLSVAQIIEDPIISVWPVNDFPDPNSGDEWEQARCRRENRSSICDPNGLISSRDADQIDALIKSVYRDTDAECGDNRGYIIRVALMPQMQRIVNFGNTSHDLLIEARVYAYLLSQRWRMEGACRETVLILYSKLDDLLYTQTGPKARRRLSDSDITIISLSVRHFFTQDSTIAEGIKEMIRRYKLVFMGRKSQALMPQYQAQTAAEGAAATLTTSALLLLASFLTSMM